MIVLGFFKQALILCKLVFDLLVSHFEDVIGLLIRFEFSNELLTVLVELVVFLLSSVEGGITLLEASSQCLISTVIVLTHALKLVQFVLHKYHDLIPLADLLLTGCSWEVVFISELCPHPLEILACILLYFLNLLLQ